MAEIIDITERRKPRTPQRERARGAIPPWIPDPAAYFDHVVTPVAAYWQSWFSAWGSLFLAPWGLQVLPVEPPPRPAPQNRAGPRS